MILFLSSGSVPSVISLRCRNRRQWVPPVRPKSIRCEVAKLRVKTYHKSDSNHFSIESDQILIFFSDPDDSLRKRHAVHLLMVSPKMDENSILIPNTLKERLKIFNLELFYDIFSFNSKLFFSDEAIFSLSLHLYLHFCRHN